MQTRPKPQGSPVNNEKLTAIGLMSGTSADGIDAALMETDGKGFVTPRGSLTAPYPAAVRAEIKAVFKEAAIADPMADPALLFKGLSTRLAEWHGDIVKKLIEKMCLTNSQIDIIGFHGQTILHRPDIRRSWQIGDAAALASLTGIEVIGDFRTADVTAGGQGAPFLPLYHAALVATARAAGQLPDDKPVAVLNLGGVGNVTWIGEAAIGEPAILAFDTGPGNALIDDWMALKAGIAFDDDGQTAKAGNIDENIISQLMAHDYFKKLPPKSLDRQDFSGNRWRHLSLADGAATLTEFTARSVAAALAHMPKAPARWLVCGGGRLNSHLMQALQRRLAVTVSPVEAIGWHGDTLEAEGFGYLAVRSLKGLPLSLPTTTGVPRPMPGGRRFPPE